jgi:hypothetical protein
VNHFPGIGKMVQDGRALAWLRRIRGQERSVLSDPLAGHGEER